MPPAALPGPNVCQILTIVPERITF